MYEIGQKRGKAMNRTENRKDLMRRYAHLNVVTLGDTGDGSLCQLL